MADDALERIEPPETRSTRPAGPPEPTTAAGPQEQAPPSQAGRRAASPETPRPTPRPGGNGAEEARQGAARAKDVGPIGDPLDAPRRNPRRRAPTSSPPSGASGPSAGRADRRAHLRVSRERTPVRLGHQSEGSIAPALFALVERGAARSPHAADGLRGRVELRFDEGYPAVSVAPDSDGCLVVEDVHSESPRARARGHRPAPRRARAGHRPAGRGAAQRPGPRGAGPPWPRLSPAAASGWRARSSSGAAFWP